MVAARRDDSLRSVLASAFTTNGQSPTLTAEECLNCSRRLNVAFRLLDPEEGLNVPEPEEHSRSAVYPLSFCLIGCDPAFSP